MTHYIVPVPEVRVDRTAFLNDPRHVDKRGLRASNDEQGIDRHAIDGEQGGQEARPVRRTNGRRCNMRVGRAAARSLSAR